MNDGNTVFENTTHLVGDHSKVYPKTVTVGRGKQIENFTEKSVHIGLNTDAQIIQHGEQKDNATTILYAIVKIEKVVMNVDVEQVTRDDMVIETSRGVSI